MAKIDKLLEFIVENGASDLHLYSNNVPMVRLDGDIRSSLLPVPGRT